MFKFFLTNGPNCDTRFVVSNARKVALTPEMWCRPDCPYDVLTNVLPSKLTTEEIAFIEVQLPLVATYSLGTFNNCAEEDSKGNCLERVVLPKVKEQAFKEFLILRSQLFPEIDNDVN